jgi:hypothetical protein
LTINDFLVHDLGLCPLFEHRLDIDPPEAIFKMLDERTGIAAYRVKRMTARVFSTRFTTESTSSRGLFEGYAARYSVLLPARRASFEEIEDGWQPWIPNDRVKEPSVCENCLAEGKEPHLKASLETADLLELPKASTIPEAHRLCG